jgi:hypothetical protein
MVLTEAERKERRQAGMAAKSKAERIGQAFTSGKPPLPELRTPAEAVRAASVLLTGLQGTMADPKFDLSPEDCRVHVCYIDTGFTGVFSHPLVKGKEAELIDYLSGQPVLMLGLLFAIRDREKDEGNGEVVGVRPFLVTPRIEKWLIDLKTRAQMGN